MSKTSLQNLKLGIFVVLGTLLLLIASYLIGNGQNIFAKNVTLHAVFKNVNGLQIGNNVRFSGVNIGTVDKLEMSNDTSITVYMVIGEKMRKHIKKDAIATIGSDGLVGSMLVNIVPGKGGMGSVNDGDELKSYSRISTQDMLNTLNVTNENAALLTSNLLKVTQSMMEGKGVVGRLLTDTIMGQDFHRMVSDLQQGSQRANATLTELQGLVQRMNMDKSVAGTLLSDTLTAMKMRTSIENLETSSMAVKEMAQHLEQIIDSIKTGDGLFQRVTRDTTMSRLLMETMENIEQGTRKFDENMEALKHSFLTRGYFRKMERESGDDRGKKQP